MLEAAGYPGQKGALERVAQHLKMPPSTLHGWANGTRNPPPTQLRCEKKEDLIGCIKAELSNVFTEMGQAREDASYRDLTIAAGILIDKLQLLTGEPTERTESTGVFRWPNGDVVEPPWRPVGGVGEIVPLPGSGVWKTVG